MARRSFKKACLPMKWMAAVFLLIGLLMGCETTGHISSTASEEVAAAKIIPPALMEEEVVEPVVEGSEITPSIEQPMTQAVESTEEVLQEVSTDSAQPESHAPEMKKPVASPPAAPQAQPSSPSPQAPVPIEPSNADLNESIQPKKLQDIYFDFDQAAILDADKPVLESNNALLKGHFKHLNVIIEGHCDERGTVEYNLVLGMRRAQVAKAYLMDLGISPSRIRIVSYGKERPVCTEQNEACWQKNRRVHFVLQ